MGTRKIAEAKQTRSKEYLMIYLNKSLIKLS